MTTTATGEVTVLGLGDMGTAIARTFIELMNRRIADGHGDQGFSSLFELLAKQP
jgi:hypothetical protein